MPQRRSLKKSLEVPHSFFKMFLFSVKLERSMVSSTSPASLKSSYIGFPRERKILMYPFKGARCSSEGSAGFEEPQIVPQESFNFYSVDSTLLFSSSLSPTVFPVC